ncbi:MAG: hypothetical protein P1U34_11140 [Coxiellaceae bacterium]|nr:hypothetical protein [Coxiellaceae bacterium]
MELTAHYIISRFNGWRKCLYFLQSDDVNAAQRIILLLVFTVLLYARGPDNFLHPMLWAEDGTVFFQQMYNQGIYSFAQPYAGYLHTLPRVMAFIAAWFPYAIIPTIFCYLSLGLSVFVANMFLSQRFNIAYKPLLVLSLILVPSSGEPFGTLTNCNWVILPLFFFVLFASPPVRKLHAWCDRIIVFLLAFTGPVIVIASPLFVYKWYVQRSKHNAALMFLAMAGAITQAALIYYSSRIGGHSHTVDLDVIQKILAVYYAVINPSLLQLSLDSKQVVSTQLVVSLIFYGLLLSICNNAALPYRRFLYSALYAIFGMVAITIYSQLGALSTLIWSYTVGSRYFYLPSVLIVWILCFGFSQSIFKKIICGLILILMLANMTTNFTFTSPIHNDYHWKKYAKKIHDGEKLGIPINPEKWVVRLNKSRGFIKG